MQAEDWQMLYDERVAIAYEDGLRPLLEAERTALTEVTSLYGRMHNLGPTRAADAISRMIRRDPEALSLRDTLRRSSQGRRSA